MNNNCVLGNVSYLCTLSQLIPSLVLDVGIDCRFHFTAERTKSQKLNLVELETGYDKKYCPQIEHLSNYNI